MKSASIQALCRAATLLLVLSVCALAGDGPPPTGPGTEKRFPPLQVPPGFTATLFACDPLVEYPSVLAAGPRPGAIFVAADYMTGLGYDIIRHDEVRLVEDSDGDGYADRASVVAKDFNSIQGLAHDAGTLFVMHAPFLSVLSDRDGDGRFGERKDVLTGLGLPPEQNPSRLHCANGVVVGCDGWLYLALGDNGCDVSRPEGDRLVVHGGAILRCRPDGRDLHVFATGLRNIYDVALDEDLNVFVRDNENDGGDYMVRVAHSFFGADHGYPYLYAERPAEALAPLADLGRGSSGGGICYLEDAFPPEFRGDLFFCEWGRAVMRYRPRRAASGFAPLTQHEFATGDPGDPYGFKPTDLVAARDGALIVADWGDGQRPRRGRGRIYRITPPAVARPGPIPDTPDAGLEATIARLDSERQWQRHDAETALVREGLSIQPLLRAAIRERRLGVRGRIHAVWLLAGLGGLDQVSPLLELAKTDPEPRVQVQAVRALADLGDPILAEHRLDAGPGDRALAARLAALAQGKDPRVVLEVVIALGRIGWPDTPRWLRTMLANIDPDPALEHAAMHALRSSRQWDAVLRLVDEPAAAPIRGIALRALADRYEPEVVDGLIARLTIEASPQGRREFAELLTRVARKPGPWTYWGYRPPPRPAHTIAWERTGAVEEALNQVLADPDRAVRLATLRRMQREQVGTRFATLESWLRIETEPAAVSAILGSLSGHAARQTRSLLEALIRDRNQTVENRQTAVALWAAGLDAAGSDRLPALAESIEDGPLLATFLRQIGAHRVQTGASLLIGKLNAAEPELRWAAVESLAALGVPETGERVRALLRDPDITVRRAAAAAMGALRIGGAGDALLDLTRDPDPGVRAASLDALRLLREPRVVPAATGALAARETQPAALRCLADLGGPDNLPDIIALARGTPPTDVLHQAVLLLSDWGVRGDWSPAQRLTLERTLAAVQGAGGVVARWQVAGPLGEQALSSLIAKVGAPGGALEACAEVSAGWKVQLAAGLDSQLRLRSDRPGGPDSSWVLCSDVDMVEATAVQFLASSGGRLRIWLNGRAVYERASQRPFVPDSDRFDASLDPGPNRLIAAVTPVSDVTSFHLRFRRKASTAERERLMQRALTQTGNADRGRSVFQNLEKSQCLKCHRLGDQGARIGPDLTAIGSRFPRAYLIESVLEPSRTIAPSFETIAIALGDGRVLTGVRTAETETALTLADPEGKAHVLRKSDIEAQRPQATSLMPDGLEKPLTADEFVDLIAFLAGQK
jgi:putative membrane-bound dehydrogenase-like protein